MVVICDRLVFLCQNSHGQDVSVHLPCWSTSSPWISACRISNSNPDFQISQICIFFEASGGAVHPVMNSDMVRKCFVFCVDFLLMHGNYLGVIMQAFAVSCCYYSLISSFDIIPNSAHNLLLSCCILAAGSYTFRPAGQDKNGSTNKTSFMENGRRSGGT